MKTITGEIILAQNYRRNNLQKEIWLQQQLKRIKKEKM